MAVDKGEICVEQGEKRFLAVAPGEMTAGGRRGLPLAHLCYRVGGGLHLFRANSPVAPQGGLMVIEDNGFSESGEAEPFCGEVLRECVARRFSGVFCRFRGKPQDALAQVCQRLGQQCREKGLECYVTEGYAGCREAKVVISTALSGGSLRGRLEEAGSRFGFSRVCVWVERVAEDFPLPSPTGRGKALGREELEKLREEKGGSVFFSPELCAHYFTYMAGEEGHFVLFDDAGSLRQKLRVAREAGVRTAFLPYGAMEDVLDRVLGRR